MKNFVFSFVFALLVFLTTNAFAREQSLLARVTVYWASGGSDAATREHKCATGARLRVGHCAVDPKKIPYGSKVIFEDATCVAVDTGRDVINRKAARRAGRTDAQRSALVVDRFFETKKQAMSWAGAHPHFMMLRIVPPNERVAESSKSLPIAVSKSQTTAQKTSIAKQNIAIPRVRQVVISGLAKIPQDKLVADNNDRGGLQLPRRL